MVPQNSPIGQGRSNRSGFFSPIILIDVSNLAFRFAYAFRGLESDGQPTGMFYGAVKAINDLREKISRRIVFCWDHGVPGVARQKNWREEFVKSYKGTRKHDEEERRRILAQFPDLFKAFTWLGYSSVSAAGLEADDVIGILASEIKDPVLIFSTDKDFYQLLDSHVEILVPKKDKGLFRKISARDVEKEYGVPVARWAEYLALGGDSSDNIKPRKGMGPKTAAKLIQEGIRLDLPFRLQPLELQKRHADLEEIWPTILRSYEAARIPTSWDDPRIAKCLDCSTLRVSYHTEQKWRSDSDRKICEENFIRYCADRNMVTLIAMRRALFQNNILGEHRCPVPKQNRPVPKQKSPVLPWKKKSPLQKSIWEL